MTNNDQAIIKKFREKYYLFDNAYTLSFNRKGFTGSSPAGDFGRKMEQFILDAIHQAREEERERIKIKVGYLRLWLNEDRIKSVERFVTNDQIEYMLELYGLKQNRKEEGE